jgi:membrane protease subunit HflK
LQQLLTGRAEVQTSVQKLIQSILDNYGAGIYVDKVQLGQVDAPGPVIAAFRDVQSADQDKKRFVKEAQTYADQNVPRAKGDADRIIAAAEGFRDQQIAEATGQAARFLKVYEEYKKAPDVTRQRLFLEMQERVLSGADKIILDQKNGGQGIVPYLPLDQLQRRKSTDGGQP